MTWIHRGIKIERQVKIKKPKRPSKLRPGLDIIFEDSSLLVINKPAGLVCHPTKAGEDSSLIGRVRQYLGKDRRPHMVNRLDRETSGLTLVALQDETARELRRLWEDRNVEKEYLAIVHGHVREEARIIDAPLGKDERSRVAVKDCVRPDGLASRTEFQVISRFQRPGSSSCFTFLQVRPSTGRKHQIRIHLAHIGHPVVGDKLYGGDEDLYLALVENRLTPEQRARLILPNQALHARAVRFAWHGVRTEFLAEPENGFKEFVNGDFDTRPQRDAVD